MGWVEELTPDDDVKVEIIYPEAYAKYSLDTIKRYTSGISHLCKGAVLLGEEDTKFLVCGMTILQVLAIEKILRQFGVEMTYDSGFLSNGTRWTYFYADLRGLKELMEGEENGRDE
jgi:hypothetical protein